MKKNTKYQKALQSIPAPGSGRCHNFLLGVANRGVWAGLSSGQMFFDIRNAIPDGSRLVPDSEIKAAITRACLDAGQANPGGRYKPGSLPSKPRPAVKSGFLDKLFERGKGFSESDFRNASPTRPHNTPEHNAVLLLETLFEPDDFLFLGNCWDTAVQPVEEWVTRIKRNGISDLPHIIPNPLTGRKHPTKSGSLSFRCDAAVKDYRYFMVEFDNLTKAEQLAFWAALPLPVAALIDSGGKSIHGWIKVDGVSTPDGWNKKIKVEMYERRLEPLGVDSACKNAARLSRLPGHFRGENGRYQQLIYLNPNPDLTPILDGGSR